jgi:UDP-GlcNAc:undecaprenyl-phosphate GlcNAc-1-phosphate transferase
MIEVSLLIFSFFIIFFINKFRTQISNKFQLIDRPNKIRKLHSKNVPLLGGIMIFSTFVLINLYLLFFENLNKVAFIIFSASTFFFVLGLIDDYKNISYKYKIFFSAVFFYLFVSLDPNLQLNKIYFSTLGESEIYLNNFSIPFTVLCLLLLINAINLIDGINGLCISISIIFIFWLIIIFQNTQSLYILLIASLFYILLFNLKNNIFLGDSGSLFLGSLIGLNLVSNYNLQISKIYFPAEDIFIALMLPGLDMLRVFASRIFNKKNPFSADRSHLHHLLLACKLPQSQVLFLFIILIITPILINQFVKISQIKIIVFYIFLYFSLIISLKKFTT